MAETPTSWFALQVKPKHEKKVAHLLSGAVQLDSFLPTYRVRHRWTQRDQIVELPLFPGYVFCSFGRTDWPRVINVPGVIDAVRFGRTLAVLDEFEIDSLRIAERARSAMEPCAYLATGESVYINSGPLTGLRGIVTDDEGGAYVVLSVTLLQRSIRVAVDRASVSVQSAITQLAA